MDVSLRSADGQGCIKFGSIAAAACPVKREAVGAGGDSAYPEPIGSGFWVQGSGFWVQRFSVGKNFNPSALIWNLTVQ
jgi:hypothetical protein